MERLETDTSKENGTSLYNRKYYATGEEVLTNFLTVYALMQCTPDLSTGQCGVCLHKSVQRHQNSNISRGKQGGIIAWPQCFFRWDMQPFGGAFVSGESSNCKNYYCNNLSKSIITLLTIYFVED